MAERSQLVQWLRWRALLLLNRIRLHARGKPISWRYDAIHGSVPNGWSHTPALKWFLVLVFGILALASVRYLPSHQGELWRDFLRGQERPLFVNEARRTVLQFWGGLVVLLGLYFGWRRLRATDEANTIERERHVTERFTKAIEQIGHEQPAVQIGAIFALERISRDSPDLNGTVTDILLAFVRIRCRIAQPYPLGEVQAALTVLGRRPQTQHDQVGRRVDLSQLDLSGYDLSRCSFRRCIARGTLFNRANLEYSDFYDSDLRGAQFVHVKAFLMDISHCNATSSVWGQANMQAIRGAQVQLKKALLILVNLKHADLRGSWLDRSDLRGSLMTNANLTSARAIKASFREALMSGANLTGADLRGADFQAADLTGAVLNGTMLRKADLSTAIGISVKSLEEADTDPTTQFPTSP